jgi:hypothetical protein
VAGEFPDFNHPFAAKEAVEATVLASEFAGQGQLCP